MKLLAGRVGQVINYASLSNDVGVDIKTIKNWMSILESSFLVYKLAPYYENFGKRVIKSPKYYFTDTGLLSFLLGIHNSAQIERDPLVGHLYENLIVIECLKARYNQGKMGDLYFYRDSNGKEVDIIFASGRKLIPIEVKSSSTFTKQFLSGLRYLKSMTNKVEKSYVVYNGDTKLLSENIWLLHTSNVEKIFY